MAKEIVFTQDLVAPVIKRTIEKGNIIVENVLSSTSTVNALSANMGKTLNDKYTDVYRASVLAAATINTENKPHSQSGTAGRFVRIARIRMYYDFETFMIGIGQSFYGNQSQVAAIIRVSITSSTGSPNCKLEQLTRSMHDIRYCIEYDTSIVNQNWVNIYATVIFGGNATGTIGSKLLFNFFNANDKSKCDLSPVITDYKDNSVLPSSWIVVNPYPQYIGNSVLGVNDSFVMKGNENRDDSDMSFVRNANGSVNAGGNLTAIRTAIRFRWYGHKYDIGAVRDNGSNTYGFGITYGTGDVPNTLVATFEKTTSRIFSNLAVTGTLTSAGTSDIRLKDNIKYIDDNDSLEKILKLKPATFNWSSDDSLSGFIGTKTGEYEVGLVAQDVRDSNPDMVKEIHNGKYLGVKYEQLTSYLIGSIKELNKKIDELSKNK